MGNKQAFIDCKHRSCENGLWHTPRTPAVAGNREKENKEKKKRAIMDDSHSHPQLTIIKNMRQERKFVSHCKKNSHPRSGDFHNISTLRTAKQQQNEASYQQTFEKNK